MGTLNHLEENLRTVLKKEHGMDVITFRILDKVELYLKQGDVFLFRMSMKDMFIYSKFKNIKLKY